MGAMPNPQINNSMLDLLFQAGPMAKLVLLLLMSASVVCWAVILMKWNSLRHALQENEEFLNVFWHGKSVEEIFSKSDRFARSPVAMVFQAGVKELKKLSGPENRPLDQLGIENLNRALLRASNSEIKALEKYTGWLASTASAAPFVGLFGTVWGIMNSFQNIGATGAANLAVVAPGISEALITTATGIGVAIPAVIGFNYFAGQIKRMAVDMDCFTHDFLNIIQRNAINGRKGE